MKRQRKTIECMNRQTNGLIEDFDSCLDYFEENIIFSGPSVKYHKETIAILLREGISKVFENDFFYDRLYSTLTSWGLHRMGDTKTKLVGYEKFKDSIFSQKDGILNLKDKKITNLSDYSSVLDDLLKIINCLKIGEGDTKLVFNSKTIHHFLPDLMPPIDRQYILLFFYNTKRPSQVDDCFSEIFPKFVEIGTQKRNSILDRIGSGFHTSQTKVIDNAIIGYVLKNKLKRGEDAG